MHTQGSQGQDCMLAASVVQARRLCLLVLQAPGHGAANETAHMLVSCKIVTAGSVRQACASRAQVLWHAPGPTFWAWRTWAWHTWCPCAVITQH